MMLRKTYDEEIRHLVTQLADIASMIQMREGEFPYNLNLSKSEFKDAMAYSSRLIALTDPTSPEITKSMRDAYAKIVRLGEATPEERADTMTALKDCPQPAVDSLRKLGALFFFAGMEVYGTKMVESLKRLYAAMEPYANKVKGGTNGNDKGTVLGEVEEA